jgi:murein DD-endopeptidase MepM/ murein hydrolase activator NlpD
MKLKSILIGIGAVLLMGGTAWSVGNTLKVSPWDLAPKLSNFKPDPKDTAFYYPLPEVVEVTSPFGYRSHPLSGDRRMHSGEDLGAPEGMPVLAAHSGYVDYTGWDDGYGNLIILQYADGQYQTWYAHLSEILVKEGEPIRARQVIGKVGSTGGVTGPHLHLEIRKKQGGDFVAIDPAAQIKAAESYVAYKPPEPGQRDVAVQPEPIPLQAEQAIPLTEKPIQSAPESAQSPIAEAGSAAPSEYQAPGMRPRNNALLDFDPSNFGTAPEEGVRR